MDKILIRGGNPLHGDIVIGGAKNAALPLQAACLLTAEPLILENVPALADIKTMNQLLAELGADVDVVGDRVTLHAADIGGTTADYELVRKMRASMVVLGPLLARFGEARVSLPGGCAIGTRPVDIHLKGFEQMGAEIVLEGGYVIARATKGLAGGHVLLPFPSVGATENLLMAACLAKGETVIANAAREPEVTDLALCLKAMGAEISGEGTDTLRIQGRDTLHGATHRVVSDRIEAGTYAVAAAITGGDLHLLGGRLDHLEAVSDVLRRSGVTVTQTDRGLRVARTNGPLRGCDVMTEPYPGFPTDMQAQMMVLFCTAQGAAMMTETIFENRFMHVPELTRMGADINVHNSSAIIRGVPTLSGAQVMATDLRASVSLVLAGLVATGETVVNRVYHLDRGYERIEEKLSACGATIERIPG